MEWLCLINDYKQSKATVSNRKMEMTCKHHQRCMYMYRVKGCNETKSGEHCGLASVSGKVRVSRRQQLWGMSGCEEGGNQGAAGTSQWISTKETWAHRHAAIGTKTSSGSSFAEAILLSVLPMAINVERQTQKSHNVPCVTLCVYALCILGQQGQTRLVQFGNINVWWTLTYKFTFIVL